MILIGKFTKIMETAQEVENFFLNNKKPGVFSGDKMFFCTQNPQNFMKREATRGDSTKNNANDYVKSVT